MSYILIKPIIIFIPISPWIGISTISYANYLNPQTVHQLWGVSEVYSPGFSC